MRHHQVALLCLWSGALCGCVDFVQAKRGEPVAQLEVVSGGTAFTANTYVSFDADPCTNNNARMRNMTAGFGWASSGKTELALPAGKPLYVRGDLKAMGGGGSELSTYICIALASFTPQESHRYRMTQVGTTAGCALVIVDIATNLPPEGLALLDAKSCGRH